MPVDNNKSLISYLFLDIFRDLSSCLETLHCPINVKSFGSLIVNLLHLLGINDCNTDDQTCPNEKRLIILKELFTHWTKSNDDTYCK